MKEEANMRIKEGLLNKSTQMQQMFKTVDLIEFAD